MPSTVKSPFKDLELWFLTGSQNLYGPETLAQVAADTNQIVRGLNDGKRIPIRMVSKGVLTTPEEIRAVCIEAGCSADCIGVVLWMHTFSPSKMWIGGL